MATDLTTLPDGWTATAPGPDDVADLAALAAAFDVAGSGVQTVGAQDVEMEVCGPGAAVRRHVSVRDAERRVRGWASLHDRAAGRVLTAVMVDPDLAADTADAVAAALFGWADEHGGALATQRGLAITQLDAGAFEADQRQQAWLQRAGYEKVRTWWQMVRPVHRDEGRPGALPEPGDGVVIRTVVDDDRPRPSVDDLRVVHDVIEEAFADHFNHHEETFDEFLARLEHDPGHSWDHWWLAEVTTEDGVVPAGALVGQEIGGAGGTVSGSYVSYLGVLRTARGRGVARSLLHAIIADAASRGRDRVKLEVDATSPTGAHELYTSLDFVTTYTTQSWHRDVLAR